LNRLPFFIRVGKIQSSEKQIATEYAASSILKGSRKKAARDNHNRKAFKASGQSTGKEVLHHS
jgi:hypothetical protein